MDAQFLEQAPEFLSKALKTLGIDRLADLRSISEDIPTPLAPVVIHNSRHVTAEEKYELAKTFYGRDGVASFVLMNPDSDRAHPLTNLAEQLADSLPLRHPILHPAEADKRAEKLLGPSDGTLKVFQRSDQDNSLQSKELHLHQDGIGLGGTVIAVGLYCESGPLWGGFTCFQNALRLVLELARNDCEAFQSLFYPTALTVVRREGRKALKVTGPVLYLNALNQPQVFLRAAGGDYEMIWLDEEAVARARQFLQTYLKPFALASSFAELSVPGQGCFIRNTVVLHGRTKFLDALPHRRVLARKWFASTDEDAQMKQVPGLKIRDEYAALRPDLFGKEVLRGEWTYDRTSDRNVAIRP
jgi:Taurine catabolism dioxygenase TauD, TfdA family